MGRILIAVLVVAATSGVANAQSYPSFNQQPFGATVSSPSTSSAPVSTVVPAAGIETQPPTSPSSPLSPSPPSISGTNLDHPNGLQGLCDLPCTCHDYRFWASADYLLWQVKGDNLPPLVATSPAGTPRTQAGVLGAPGATTLYGGTVDQDWRSGGRAEFGYWLDCEGTCGIQADFFILGDGVGAFTGASTGSPIIARPFFNGLTGMPDAELVAFPGVLAGAISVRDVTTLWGTGVSFRHSICCGDCYWIDGLLGWRYLNMTDRLDIAEDLTSTSITNPTVPLGTHLFVQDHFYSTNDFNGAELGLTGEFRRGPWVLDWCTKVALGVNAITGDISGSTSVTVPGMATTTSPGGLLALSSNSGHYLANRFSVVPEVGLKVGYQITPHVIIFAGYDFMYWNNVVRPGGMIDTVVNPNLLPPPILPLTGASRPEPRLASTDLWVQGVSFGVEFRY